MVHVKVCSENVRHITPTPATYGDFVTIKKYQIQSLIEHCKYFLTSSSKQIVGICYTVTLKLLRIILQRLEQTAVCLETSSGSRGPPPTYSYFESPFANLGYITRLQRYFSS